MNVLAQQPWEFTLYEDKGRLLLEVTCGSVAMYELAIELNAQERAAWESKGEAGLMPLVEKVRYSPKSYEDRKIALPA